MRRCEYCGSPFHSSLSPNWALEWVCWYVVAMVLVVAAVSAVLIVSGIL